MAASNFNNIIVHFDDQTSCESNVNNLLATESNCFKGWTCWAGIQNITIDNKGDVYRAICRVGGSLGNIYEGFTIPTEPIVCTKEKCTCAADIQLTKAEEKFIYLTRIGKDNV